jgi:putative phosphoesterase
MNPGKNYIESKNMKIFALTDIHGRQHFSDSIAQKMHGADIIAIAGDITHFGDMEEADVILRSIKTINDNILAVSGNCDYDGVNTALNSHEINLHGTCKTINKIVFCGLNGSNKTPLHTPQEYTEEEIEGLLEKYQKNSDVHLHVLLSHAPPAKTTVDKIFLGLHVGSKALRTYIEKLQPALVICGHIHEARGVDTIGKTLVINPGPFPKHYALITCTDSITYELY